MWPGEQQPGGQQYPQQPEGSQYPQQPGGQPYPQQYPQHPPQQFPSPYAPQQHPAYQPPPPPWGAQTLPGGPGAPKPPGNRRGVAVAVSVVAAAAVAAAGVLIAVKLTGDDSGRPEAGPSASGTPTASASPSDGTSSAPPSPTASDDGPGADDARGNPGESAIKPVVAGWQTVVRSDMGVAYDVPKNWTVKAAGLLIGYEWDKNRIVTGGAATLGEDWCGTDQRGMAGVKGGKGAESLKSEAANEAYNWAYAKYNQEGGTKLTQSTTRTYKNGQGVSGWISSTRATGMKGKCAADGTAYSFTFLSKDKEVRSWILVVDGFKGAPDAKTIAKVRDSVRLIG
ncbi:hypothetical protein ACFWVC_04965 [Streptomyces sp. NPDC058691]|uniref:hypothetical protein n=1 Tax=Streptomyces sp. NPDC058691 TaxID=3346601 RepID=UPI0036644E66